MIRTSWRGPRHLLVVAAVGALIVTGCSSTDGAALAGSDANIAADSGANPAPVVGVALPEGFPSDIPLPDLPIASATALTTTHGWIVNFKTDDGPGEMAKAHKALNKAGFVDAYWAPENGTGLVKGDTYHVQVMLTEENSWISFAVRLPAASSDADTQSDSSRPSTDDTDSVADDANAGDAELADGADSGAASSGGTGAPGMVAPEDMTIEHPDEPKNLCDAMFLFQMGQLGIDGTQESIDKVFGIVEQFDAEMTDELRDTIAFMRAAYEKGVGADDETRMGYLTTDEFVEASASLIDGVLQSSCAAAS